MGQDRRIYSLISGVRPSSYVAFQSKINIMQTKLIREIKFVGKATYETVRGIKFVQTFYLSGTDR